MTWSKGRQLTNYNGTTFGYDGQGQRTSKGNIIYTYGSDGKLLKQSDGWEFLYDNGGVMGFIYGNTTDDNRYLYRKDILGNITGILDKNGKIIVKYKYDAWGNHAAVCLNLKDGREEFCDITDETISFTGKYATYKTLAEKNPFRYRSYYYDTETDMYYLKTRYYDPEIGRFITIDDVSYLEPDTINGLNLYAYCGNNPIMRVDANGTAWWHWVIGALVVVGLVVGTVVSAGGLGAGLMAIGFAANGMVMAGASMATTIFAFATVGAGVAFAASGVVAGMGAIETWATGGSFSDGLNEVGDYGSVALGTTIGGGFFGGIAGYQSYKALPPAKGKSYGTYLIKDKDNNVIYVGKGDFNRMKVSMRERGGASGSWFEAPDELSALLKEALWINDYGGPQSMKEEIKNVVLLNKINSPGLRYLIWWLS